MKITSNLLLLAALILLITSCKPSRDKMLTRIEGMEESMKVMRPPDTVKLAKLAVAYEKFAQNYPQDSLAPEYLFKAGGIDLSLNRVKQSIEMFRSVQTTYPAYRKAPECVFMQAFIYENSLHDLAKASQLYNEFIAKYPNHSMVADARNALKYLGKPAEEMIRDFEAKNAARADSLKAAGK